MFTLPRMVDRSRVIQRVAGFLSQLDAGKAWTVEVKQVASKRSLSQNRLLWMIYDQILERGGEAMGGWTKEDLHDFFLLDHFGGEPKELFGRFRNIPFRRSSRLNKQEFSDFVEHIVRFMAHRGVVIDMPEDME